MSIEHELQELSVLAPETVSDGVALGTGLSDGYKVFESPVGDVVVAFNPAGVSSVDLSAPGFEERFEDRFHRPLLAATLPKGWDGKVHRAIDRGTPGDLPVDLRAVSEFQQQVLHVTANIPRGQVRSYSWLAQHVGRPKAVRAVGSSMARNPVPLIIPCHRVVRSDGHIGNYSLGGSDRKEQLLHHEGTDPQWLEDLAARHVRFVGSTSTSVFCHPTCGVARRIANESRIEFRSGDSAVGAGFEPCSVCEPA